MKFQDRREAGLLLAERIMQEPPEPTIVFGIPRGGIILSDVIADRIGAEMDIVVPRKLGAPNNSELAIGAIAEDGTLYINDRIVTMLGIPSGYIMQEEENQLHEIERRSSLYRKPETDFYSKVNGRRAILVDDGIATGATVIAAARWLKKRNPNKLIIAVPVAPHGSLDQLRQDSGADEVLALDAPYDFGSVGQFYENFEPVSDEQVISIMKKRNLL